MPFAKQSKATRYRVEGLSLLQADRMEATHANSDFKRTLIIAGLAFMLVGSLSFIAMSSLSPKVEATPTAAAPVPAPSKVAVILPADIPLNAQASAAPEWTQTEPLAAPLMRPALPVPNLDVAEDQIDDDIVNASVEIPAPEPANLPEPAVQLEAPVEEIETVEEAVQTQSCVSTLAQIAKQSTLYFQDGNTKVSGAHLNTLAKLGRMAMECPEATIQVTGHADTDGDDLANLDLSWKRADSAVNAMSQIGLNSGQFQPVGLGARAPVAQGDTSDEDKNRRVEFIVLRSDTATQ